MVTDLGVRAGFVYKTDRDGWQQVNASRPYSNFNIPVTVVDPGADGVYGNGDDANVAAFNLSDTTTAASNTTRNIDGYENDFKTIEFAVNKRYSNRWSMNASFSHTWTHQFGNLYFNNRFGTQVANFSLFGSYPVEPEREDAERVHRLERQGRPARSTPAGACA